MKLVAPTAYAFRTHQIYTNLKTQSWDSGGSCAHLLLGRRYWPPTQYSASAGRYLRIRRWGGCVYVLQMFFVVFLSFFVFFRSPQNTRQQFSRTAERIFMKLLPNDSGHNVVSNVVPKWGLGPRLNFFLGGGGLKTTHCALGGDAWRVTEN